MAKTGHEMFKHPMQPIYADGHGVQRFKPNAIVDYMATKIGLNELHIMPFTNEDHDQLAQLIGYSVSGYGDLSYVNPLNVAAADHLAANGGTELDARLVAAEQKTAEYRKALSDIQAVLYNMSEEV